MSDEKGLQTTSQMLIYQAEDGQTKIEVQLQDETVWLTQKHMAELFQTSKQNIGQHLNNIFEEGELEESSVVKKFFTTAADGKRYQTFFYSLDAIISVGYRIKSHIATRFRQWARGLNVYPTYFTVSVTHPPCLCPFSTHTLAGFFMPGDRG
ncbi:MAG: virulence RhuM family protein [Proteobacteria bacterium]|nr:virulence RhuM family protein [Pseudomonadota bacterium]MBU1648020.1 virulence RhuM family protein [Pseudomonadota bacterium]